MGNGPETENGQKNWLAGTGGEEGPKIARQMGGQGNEAFALPKGSLLEPPSRRA